MNRIRLLASGTMLMFGLTVLAQEAATSSAAQGSGMPTVENHLKLLSEKLDLTGGQQAKIRPILQEMHDSTQKLMQDESLSREERTGKIKACHDKADKRARQILNDDQKKKLDQLEQEPYPEQHGDTNGATPPARAPQN
jgi:Spy/CpxP family protein refolding chaperone